MERIVTSSMDPHPLVCRGAPRDMGADEGRALIARGVLLTGGRGSRCASPAERGALRDLRRHIPQQAERLVALADVLGLAPASLVAEVDQGSARIRWGPDGHPVLEAGGGRLRRSLPDAGFKSLEWQSRATAVPSFGVNEPGLRIVAIQGSPEPRDLRCSAPAIFLLPEVLQRFADARVAADWLARRPSSGTVRFFLTDSASADWLGLTKVGERSAVDASEDRPKVAVVPRSGIALHFDGILWRSATEEAFYPVSHQ